MPLYSKFTGKPPTTYPPLLFLIHNEIYILSINPKY